MKSLFKKGQGVMNGLQVTVLAIVSLAIILAIGLYVLQEVQNATTADGTSTGASTKASNATGTIISKLSTAPTWIGILIVVIFAAAVMTYFYFRG